MAVVGHLEGPLLVIAGPGAGKTRTVVWRAVNLLLLGAVNPAELVMCTFSKRAAHELRQRFDAAASAAGCAGDLSAVRITTVHSLCRRILREQGQRGGLKPDFTLLDEWQQLDLMNSHFHRIFGPDRDELRRHGWRTHDYTVRQGRRYIERVAEEGIAPECLADSDDSFHAALGRCCLRYEAVLQERGALDLSRLQVRTDALLQDDSIAQNIGAAVRHLMVDEYQDTSCIQERVLLRLARGHGNPCVVGDDDQSIYRFRGASVRNLLEFPERFPQAKVRHTRHQLPLPPRHRDPPATAGWPPPTGPIPRARGPALPPPQDRGSQRCRLPRRLPLGHRGVGQGFRGRGPPVGGVAARLLKAARGVIADYAQAALLLHSVQERRCERYLAAFREAGVPYHRAPAAARPQHPAPGGPAKGSPAGARFPTARVCVTTIHQAKGLEWPVVVVGSLDDAGGGGEDDIGGELAPHFPRPPFEPPGRLPDLDADAPALRCLLARPTLACAHGQRAAGAALRRHPGRPAPLAPPGRLSPEQAAQPAICPYGARR